MLEALLEAKEPEDETIKEVLESVEVADCLSETRKEVF